MIFQGDIVIKTAIELGMDDMRKNPWLIDDMLSDLVNIPYLSDKYGQKQIDACKEWFANNKIDIYLVGRSDKDQPPCITIALGSSSEKPDMKAMADQSTETVMLMPNQIGKPVPFVVKPFAVTAFDKSTGLVSVDPSTKNLEAVSAGMILVDPQTGSGFSIIDITPNGILIASGSDLKSTLLGIVPQFQFYSARIEHTFFQEQYKIGCHSHGNPQVLLWLHSIVMYSLLRYRESLLEANGFAESVFSSSDLSDSAFYTGPGGEEAFDRYITISGQVEFTWIKSPRRTIESVVLKDPNPASGTNASLGYTGGIKMISNLETPNFIDQSEEAWIAQLEAEMDENES